MFSRFSRLLSRAVPRRLPGLFPILLIGLPAAAPADVQSDYRAALHALGPMATDWNDELAALEQVLTRLEGTWARTGHSKGFDPEPPGPELLSWMCELYPTRIERTGPGAFDMTYGPPQVGSKARHIYLGKGRFAVQLSAQDLREQLFMGRRDLDIDALVDIGRLLDTPPVRVMAVSDQAFALVPEQGAPADIFLRCPKP